MSIPETLLELGEYFEEGYKPVLDFHGWRVAMLRYNDSMNKSNFRQVERHRNTNEVFILTTGEADLILFEGDAVPTKPHVIAMKHNVAYNIQDYGWHHVIMSKDAHIILFERTETSRETSDYALLNEEQKASVRSLLRFKD